jgi:hypothetical protein
LCFYGSAVSSTTSPAVSSSSIPNRQPGLIENQCHQSIVGAEAALFLLTVLSRRRPTESLVVAHRFWPELVDKMKEKSTMMDNQRLDDHWISNNIMSMVWDAAPLPSKTTIPLREGGVSRSCFLRSEPVNDD